MALSVGRNNGRLVGEGYPLIEAQENPLALSKRLVEKLGSEDLIDVAELTEKQPRLFRDWSQVDSLYNGRYVMSLSMMLTAAALNEVNGALALMARLTRIVYSYEKNWGEQFQEVILTEWPEQSPTSIPQGISFLNFMRVGRTTAYAATVHVPNALICDPNFSDTRLKHLFQGLNKTAAYTMQRKFALALAMRPFRNFVDKMMFHNDGKIVLEELYHYWTHHAFKGIKKEYELMSTIAEAADKYPQKDTLVVPQGVEWTLVNLVAEQAEKYRGRILDMTDGDIGRAAQDFALLEHQPDGTFRKGLGRGGTMVLCKMPDFQAVGFAGDADGCQPLLRELRLAGSTPFASPSFDNFEIPDGRRLGVSLLDMTASDSSAKIFTLSEALRETKCGLIFDASGRAAYERLLKMPVSAEERRILSSPTGYETPDENVMRAAESAKTYDNVGGFRMRPPGARSAGGLAERVGQICEAQLPTRYLLAGARALLEGARAKRGDFTTLDPAKQSEHIRGELSAMFSVNITAMPKAKHIRDTVNDSDEMLELIAETSVDMGLARPGPGGAKGAVVYTKPLEQLFHYTPDAAAKLLEPWKPTLSALVEKQTAVAKPILNELVVRIRGADTDTAKIEAHVRHAIAQFESLGLRPEGALPSLKEEHVRAFVSALPATSTLAASKIVPRTDTAVWGRANALLDASGFDVSPTGVGPRQKQGDAMLDPSRPAQLAVLSPDMTSEELAVLTLIFTRPFDLDTCVRMASIGIPIVTGQLERWAMTFYTLSALVAKSDEVGDTIMTPMRVTVTSRGVRRITDFTEEFAMGQRWNNPDALVDLPSLFGAGVGGGMNTRVVTDVRGVQAIVRGVNVATRADVMFVPRSPGERTLHYPMNWLGDVWQKTDVMGVDTRQPLYYTVSGYRLYREYIGQQALALFRSAIRIDVVLGSNGSVGMPAQVVVERMPTMKPRADGAYDIPVNGTGPIGAMNMQHPANEPHIVFKGRGGLFGLDPTKGTLPAIAAY